MKPSISRRCFLSGGVAAAAGLTILPSGLARGYRANEKMNLALIGCGGRGRWFAGLIPRIGQNMAALCDVDQQKAAGAFRDFPDTPKYADFSKMLDERAPQPDGVIRATPDNPPAVLHMAALRAGKPAHAG